MHRSLTVVLIVLSFILVSSVAGAVAPSTGFVPVPGGKLFYEEQGAGPAVILIHGGMLDLPRWSLWRGSTGSFATMWPVTVSRRHRRVPGRTSSTWGSSCRH